MIHQKSAIIWFPLAVTFLFDTPKKYPCQIHPPQIQYTFYITTSIKNLQKKTSPSTKCLYASLLGGWSGLHLAFSSFQRLHRGLVVSRSQPPDPKIGSVGKGAGSVV